MGHQQRKSPLLPHRRIISARGCTADTAEGICRRHADNLLMAAMRSEARLHLIALGSR